MPVSEVAFVIYTVLICGIMEIVWTRHSSKFDRADFFVYCLNGAADPKREGFVKWTHLTGFLIGAFPLFVLVAITHHKEMKQAYEQTRKTKAGG